MKTIVTILVFIGGALLLLTLLNRLLRLRGAKDESLGSIEQASGWDSGSSDGGDGGGD